MAIPAKQGKNKIIVYKEQWQIAILFFLGGFLVIVTQVEGYFAECNHWLDHSCYVQPY